MRADDRDALERLCKYILRPPVAQDRLERTTDGRVLVTLKAEWSNGTTHLPFEPVEFLEKLAVLTPRPRINLLIYHGVLAPHADWRRRAVARGGRDVSAPAAPSAAGADPGSGSPCPDSQASQAPSASAPADADPAPASSDDGHKPRHWTWANLMRRAFDLDVLACPRCGSRMTLIATIEDPAVVRRILRHLDLPTDLPQPHPSRSPPALEDSFPDTRP